MANKLGRKKAVVKKIEPADAMAPKEEPTPDGSNVLSPKTDVFNDETEQVLRDADAGKNLTRYVDADDLFRKLGIKIGKA